MAINVPQYRFVRFKQDQRILTQRDVCFDSVYNSGDWAFKFEDDTTLSFFTIPTARRPFGVLIYTLELHLPNDDQPASIKITDDMEYDMKVDDGFYPTSPDNKLEIKVAYYYAASRLWKDGKFLIDLEESTGCFYALEEELDLEKGDRVFFNKSMNEALPEMNDYNIEENF